MSFRNLDLNFPASEEDVLIHANEGESLNNLQPFDLNTALEDYMTEDTLDEEIMNHGRRETTLNIDLNQPPAVNIDLNQPPETDSEQEEIRDDQTSKRKKELSNDERQKVYLALLQRSFDGKLRKGTIKEVSQLFSLSTRTISRIWMQAKDSLADGNDMVYVNHRKTRNCGRKRIQIDREQFGKIPLRKRMTIRSAACAMEVSKSTLHRIFQAGDSIRRHSNPVKPMLKDSNKIARVQFCLSMLDMNSGNDPKFLDMLNVIHIDEKWFYISKKCEKYYLLLEECDPVRTCKSKNYLTKVMFLAAMARPRFDSDGNEIFSRKIGIFPYITEEPAKRSSVNRPAGTLETKVITSVGKICRDHI